MSASFILIIQNFNLFPLTFWGVRRITSLHIMSLKLTVTFTIWVTVTAFETARDEPYLKLT